MPLDMIKYCTRLWKKLSTRGHPGSTGTSNVNLGPPNISKITRAKMLKLKMQLDIVKYSIWVYKKFLLWVYRAP